MLLVFPVAVRPSLLLCCPPVPAELGTAHLLPLPSAPGMAEPKGSVTAAVSPLIPFIPFIYASLPEGGRGVQGHIPSPTTLRLGRPQTLPRPARNAEMHKAAPGSRSGRCRSVRPPDLPGALPVPAGFVPAVSPTPGRSGGDSPGKSLRRRVSDRVAVPVHRCTP